MRRRAGGGAEERNRRTGERWSKYRVPSVFGQTHHIPKPPVLWPDRLRAQSVAGCALFLGRRVARAGRWLKKIATGIATGLGGTERY
jgi:hypothetical protein